MGLFSFIKNLFNKQKNVEVPVTIDKEVIELVKEQVREPIKLTKKEVIVDSQITDAVTTKAPKKRANKKVTK